MNLYIDCIGGIAGDMLLGALIDVGASVDSINVELTKLGVPDLQINVERVSRHDLDCCHVTVTWAGPVHADDPGHASRPYVHVRDLISGAGLAERVQARALRTFALLAFAEARVHGIEPEKVHFHEVGSEDSIADVVGVAVALELLGVDAVRCSPLPLGRGFVRAAHGMLPLPAPATMELLKGIPTEGVDIAKELVTPTGAALVAAVASSFGGFPSQTTTAVGYGAGRRDLPERPNVVRVALGRPNDSSSARAQGAAESVASEAGESGVFTFGSTEVIVLETNLDDCSPELVPDAVAAAMRAGALDVWTTPAFMKKGRPGFVMSALARRSNMQAVADAMLAETSALGIRMCAYERMELERSFIVVDVDTEAVSVKIGLRDGVIVNIAPEHDDCAAAATYLGKPVKEVYARALAAAVIAQRS